MSKIKRKLKPFKQKKTLGIALGGGGVRGLAHIGLLKILEKEKIQVHAITGTSMGAIVGAVYALGIPMSRLTKALIKYAPKRFLSFHNFNLFHASLMKGDDMDRMLRELLGDKTFADCKIPFSCTAVDIESGRPVNLTQGFLWPAVRASASLPFILPPVFLNNQVLVDGGVIDNLPLSELRLFKTQVVMGVGVNNLQAQQSLSVEIFKRYYGTKKRTLFGRIITRKVNDRLRFMAMIAMRTLEIAMKEATHLRVKQAKPDLLIEANIPIGLIEMEKGKEAIEKGGHAMQQHLEALKNLLK